MTDRVSTIYLPDRKRPMLPYILSDVLCSLLQKKLRVALVMDISVDMYGKCIDNRQITYNNALISVSNNYTYEDPRMLKSDITYSNILSITTKMDTTIKDSHDVVAFLMILMNLYTGNTLQTNKCGIFRTATINTDNIINTTTTLLPNSKTTDLSIETVRVIRTWNNISGQYVIYKPDINLEHSLLTANIDIPPIYSQITSPIRRLVDVLNQIVLFTQVLQYKFSSDAIQFYNRWTTHKMDYINISMKSIRKTQMDCDLLSKYSSNKSIMENEYLGVIIDKTNTTKYEINQYTVYIEDLKIISKIKYSDDLPLYSKINVKLYLFEDEDNIKRKIRAHITTIIK
jgi:exoribonuclease R